MITRILIFAGMLFLLSSCGKAPENLEEAIHEASANGDAIKIKEILEKAPELVNHLKKDAAKRDRMPLHGAATREVAEILVSYGADINAEDRFNWTPLHTANNREVAEYLISKGANVHTEAARQFTPLHTVDNAGAAEALIKHRADVNRQANQKITPLYWQIQPRRTGPQPATGESPLPLPDPGVTACSSFQLFHLISLFKNPMCEQPPGGVSPRCASKQHTPRRRMGGQLGQFTPAQGRLPR